MMLNLLLEEGSIITVKNASLSTGKSAVFQPQSESFLAISDPVAVFENALRSFSCLTVGDIIVLKYNNQPYEFEVKNTKPEDKICIIECDLNVEFETPLNYNRDEHQFKKYVDEESDDEDINYKNSKTKAFEGEYYSIKSSKSFENTDEMDSDKYKTGPIKNYVCGHLQFRRKRYQNKIPIPDDEITDTILFSGEHNTL
ncbi:hypothetical protein A3Q56_06381 [Intoshia linei]|uniref:Ubiquitin fusion degradation protein UFD1 N-terminal subdomain 2 domain-containing protein n=1 Tax=Intoshia linei TaxID=1819745 RepID=A0A177AWK9_9BILA|nr:hypothetical protein A3Q56_06381 [Intoshia linei]